MLYEVTEDTDLGKEKILKGGRAHEIVVGIKKAFVVSPSHVIGLEPLDVPVYDDCAEIRANLRLIE